MPPRANNRPGGIHSLASHKALTLTEQDFWLKLIYRMSAELSAMPGRRAFRYWWCDGFIPREYDLEHREIRGCVWVVEDTGDKAWQFTLRLAQPVSDVASINWQALYPPDNKEAWIDLELERRTMVLTPT